MTLPVLSYWNTRGAKITGFTYWNVRGLAAPINYLLEYVGEKYERNEMEQGKALEWHATKDTMGFDFPNLPYYIDGDVKITQSSAILKYLGRKHGLVGKNERDVQLQDMVDGITGDLFIGFSFLMYAAISKNIDEDKKKYFEERLAPALAYLEKHLASRKFAVGDYVTYVDFLLFGRLDSHQVLFPGLLDNYPALTKYQETIANLKGVKEYRASDGFFKPYDGPTYK